MRENPSRHTENNMQTSHRSTRASQLCGNSHFNLQLIIIVVIVPNDVDVIITIIIIIFFY